MNVCKWEPYSTKTVTIIYINTAFSNIVFTAYQTSANITSHCHCFWNLIRSQNMLYSIVSFQSSPDIQNCIITSSAHIQLFNFNFTTCIWPNTCSISALQCGIGYILGIEQNQPVFVWVFSYGICIQAYFSPIFYYVSNILQTDNSEILPLVFSFSNEFTFFTFYPQFIQKQYYRSCNVS